MKNVGGSCSKTVVLFEPIFWACIHDAMLCFLLSEIACIKCLWNMILLCFNLISVPASSNKPFSKPLLSGQATAQVRFELQSMSCDARNRFSGFPTRLDTNLPVRPQKMARSLKFRI